MALKRVLNRERIHDGCQHAHVIGCGTFHALRGTFDATENVPAANHHANFSPHVMNDLDFAGNPVDRLRIDTILLFT